MAAKITEVTGGLYEVNTSGVNVFLLDAGADGLILVDAAMPWSVNGILGAVRELGKQPADLKHILITHADFDHVGGLGALQAATGAHIYAGAQSADYIAQHKGPPHIPALMALLFDVTMRVMAKKATVDQRLSDGQTLDLAGGIVAIHTPGHTPDNFSYYWQRERVLFAADLLNTQFGDGLGLSPEMLTDSMPDVEASARKVLDYDPAYICVGHGSFVDVAHSADVTKLRTTLGMA
jgi:glyoxylase-like metal-dependent hydrolase (beta-lactamase superfamily II)